MHDLNIIGFGFLQSLLVFLLAHTFLHRCDQMRYDILYSAWPIFSLITCFWHHLSPLRTIRFTAGSMTFFLYRLIQETWPSAWIQLPCAYRWLLLAASLSPDLQHQLQRLITKKHFNRYCSLPLPPPQFLHLHPCPHISSQKQAQLPRHLYFMPKWGRAPQDSFSPSPLHSIPSRSQHIMLNTVWSLPCSRWKGRRQ